MAIKAVNNGTPVLLEWFTDHIPSKRYFYVMSYYDACHVVPVKGILRMQILFLDPSLYHEADAIVCYEKTKKKRAS